MVIENCLELLIKMWIFLHFEEFLDINFWFDIDAVLGALKFDLKIISIINSEKKNSYRYFYLCLSTE